MKTKSKKELDPKNKSKDVTIIDWYKLGVEHGKIDERLSQLEKRIETSEKLFSQLDSIDDIKKEIMKND